MARPKVRGIQPPPGQHPQPVAMPWRPGAFALVALPAVLFWLLAAWAARAACAAHDATAQLWQLAFGAGLMATVATGLLLRAWPGGLTIGTEPVGWRSWIAQALLVAYGLVVGLRLATAGWPDPLDVSRRGNTLASAPPAVGLFAALQLAGRALPRGRRTPPPRAGRP